MRIFCKLVLGLFLTGFINSVSADQIDNLIRRGELDRAAALLSKRVSAATRDGATLYYQSLLEKNAVACRQLLEAALKSGDAVRYREDMYYRLAQYYLLEKDQGNLSRIINEYRAAYEAGRYQAKMLRMSVIADEIAGHNNAALKQVDKYLSRQKETEDLQWGIVDKARVMNANRKRIGADQMLRRLSRAKKGIGVPQALYLLAIDAIDRNRTDDAVFLYNLLREAYPAAIGLDAIVKRLGSLESSASNNSAAEKLTGTYYSIKVGVFTKKGNAKKQAKIFRSYDHKVQIKEKKISGRKYHVVYVGRFTSWDKAMALKDKLETAHDDVYQVVAR